jgi:hypothetical protein
MDTTPKLPWYPTMRSYPLLVLDDHATEWASRITDDGDGDRSEEAGAQTYTDHLLANHTVTTADRRSASRNRICERRRSDSRVVPESRSPRAA